MEPQDIYVQRVELFRTEQKKLQQRKSIFGMLRFGSLLAIIAAFYFIWSLGTVYVVSTVLLLTITFVFLVKKDIANKAALKHLAQSYSYQ